MGRERRRDSRPHLHGQPRRCFVAGPRTHRRPLRRDGNRAHASRGRRDVRERAPRRAAPGRSSGDRPRAEPRLAARRLRRRLASRAGRSPPLRGRRPSTPAQLRPWRLSTDSSIEAEPTRDSAESPRRRAGGFRRAARVIENARIGPARVRFRSISLPPEPPGCRRGRRAHGAGARDMAAFVLSDRAFAARATSTIRGTRAVVPLEWNQLETAAEGG